MRKIGERIKTYPTQNPGGEKAAQIFVEMVLALEFFSEGRACPDWIQSPDISASSSKTAFLSSHRSSGQPRSP